MFPVKICRRRVMTSRILVLSTFDEMFPGVTNRFPWMAETIDLKKEKNFFETRVTEYQTGGALSWDRLAE